MIVVVGIRLTLSGGKIGPLLLIYGIHQFDSIDILGNAFSNFLGVAHRVNYCSRPVCDISSGENAFARGHAVREIAGDDIAFLINFNPFGGGDNS